ncbi:alpha/beta hydrolase [Leisingera sp. D0M16]|uniref:alpha/beta hydrolase n=1 Tax=Leisingera coralii TaxID=3351347 RepID=UPI003B8154F4
MKAEANLLGASFAHVTILARWGGEFVRVICAAVLLVLLSGCADRHYSPVLPAAKQIGKQHTVFVASVRGKEADGTYRHRRSSNVELMEMTVSIPSGRKAGTLNFSHGNPDPQTEFTLSEQIAISERSQLASRLKEEQTDNGWPSREVTVFVHGYNVTQVEAVFRGAQIAHDIDLPGSLTVYSWPSRARPFGYAYDLDSMLYARDGLEKTLQMLKVSGVERIILVAHSMGAALAMEMLRQAEIRNPGWARRTLNGVVLVSPDIDVDVFNSQVSSLRSVPEPFIVMVSRKDAALNISARLRGTADSKRLGNVGSTVKLRNLPIEIVDITAFSRDASQPHFAISTSPSLISVLNSIKEVNQSLESENAVFENLSPSSAGPATGLLEVVLEPYPGSKGGLR